MLKDTLQECQAGGLESNAEKRAMINADCIKEFFIIRHD